MERSIQERGDDLPEITLIAGLVLIVAVLWEAFETVILPRRVRRRFRLTRFYYDITWLPWSALVRRIRSRQRKEALLGIYGPLSLIGLLALWASGLVLGFALCQNGAGSRVATKDVQSDLWLDLYVSGTTLFTLGLGDVIPTTWIARLLLVLESGIGLGFLAIVVGYLPVIYQSFSRREVIISMLDARAGSPPTAAELLRRHCEGAGSDTLTGLLRDWEHWSAELLETHLSYPVLAYFRSQHDNQSWVGALTTILDACAIVMAGLKGQSSSQAKLTFAIARHTIVDLSQVFHTPPDFETPSRLDDEGLQRLYAALRQAGLEPQDPDGRRLSHFRTLYEPYIKTLARHLQMTLPPWSPAPSQKDNWQTTAWQADT